MLSLKKQCSRIACTILLHGINVAVLIMDTAAKLVEAVSSIRSAASHHLSGNEGSD